MGSAFRVLCLMSGVWVALLLDPGTARAETLYFIYVDHLNTPRLAVGEDGVERWRWENQEPFGDNPPIEVMGPEGYLVNLPLRFPGQYFDKETGLAYNMARDYASETGRYMQSDLIGLMGGLNTFLYASAMPLRLVDPTGLKSRVCCKNIVFGIKHCYIETQNKSGRSTLGLSGGWYLGMPGCGQVLPDNQWERGGDCGPWNEDCYADQCVKDHADLYPNPSKYSYLGNEPNSNSFTGEISRSCGLKRAPNLADNDVPGWSGRRPPVPFPDVPQILPAYPWPPFVCPPPMPEPVTSD